MDEINADKAARLREPGKSGLLALAEVSGVLDFGLAFRTIDKVFLKLRGFGRGKRPEDVPGRDVLLRDVWMIHPSTCKVREP
jgi:hypothetical protein